MKPVAAVPVIEPTAPETQEVRTLPPTKTLQQVTDEIRKDCLLAPDEFVEEVIARGGGE